MRRAGRVTLSCMTCLEPFDVPAFLHRQKFCGPECRTAPRPFTAAERDVVITMHRSGALHRDIALGVNRPLGSIAVLVAELIGRGVLAPRYAARWPERIAA